MRVPTVILLVLGCPAAAGCGKDTWCEPGPWRTEIWSDTPRVVAELREGCGWPDNPIDYRIRAEGRTVLEGSLEHFDDRHAFRRRDNGAIEIAIWDRACVVTTTIIDCHDIDYHRW